jgi:hypothetical protein
MKQHELGLIVVDWRPNFTHMYNNVCRIYQLIICRLFEAEIRLP